MNFKDLSDEQKAQVNNLLQRTLVGEIFNKDTFNGISTEVIECFEESLIKALEFQATPWIENVISD